MYTYMHAYIHTHETRVTCVRSGLQGYLRLAYSCMGTRQDPARVNMNLSKEFKHIVCTRNVPC